LLRKLEALPEDSVKYGYLSDVLGISRHYHISAADIKILHTDIAPILSSFTHKAFGVKILEYLLRIVKNISDTTIYDIINSMKLYRINCLNTIFRECWRSYFVSDDYGWNYKIRHDCAFKIIKLLLEDTDVKKDQILSKLCYMIDAINTQVVLNKYIDYFGDASVKYYLSKLININEEPSSKVSEKIGNIIRILKPSKFRIPCMYLDDLFKTDKVDEKERKHIDIIYAPSDIINCNGFNYNLHLQKLLEEQTTTLFNDTIKAKLHDVEREYDRLETLYIIC
jgi:hypothetical protein